MAYYTGDIPAEDLVIEPALSENGIDLSLFDEVEVDLRGTDGVVIESAGFLASIVDDHIEVEWPTESLLTEPGLYRVMLTLTSAEGRRQKLSPAWIVVQGDDGWATLDMARDEWADARTLADVILWRLLDTAKGDVLAYAPALPDAAPIPLRYAEAQIMQARNRWNALKVDPASGGLGEGDFVIRPFPLDWQIKQLLRPKQAVPVIG